ncbi:MAG TPA: sigma factor, partial [Polyangiales bacterium]|nr:sigma factor [Polyangiales bacterium]
MSFDVGRAGSVAVFAATDWSMIAAAAQSGSSTPRDALVRLCSSYWFPLYAYLRRKGHSTHDAEDLLQQFFATRVLTRKVLIGVRPGVGRFRSWLLTCLRNMVANELERAEQRVRRKHALIDLDAAELRYNEELADASTPDTAYDRGCIAGAIERVRVALREEYDASERGAWFEQLEGYLPGARSTRPYDEIAAHMHVEDNRVRSEVNKLRRRCGERLYA